MRQSNIVFVVQVDASFAAAHYLEGHPRCGNIHGHNWRIKVGVATRVPFEPLTGQGVDLGQLKQFLREVCSTFDHKLLNTIPPFNSGVVPSAEMIATVIGSQVAVYLEEEAFACRLSHVVAQFLWPTELEVNSQGEVAV
jgi:6-pyruvoyltetrahydropterin/6-carboxytetrahydropterin synthase